MTSKYARYNTIYRKLKGTARLLGYSDKKVFAQSDINPSNSKLDGWSRASNHRHFRVIEEDEVIAFIDGLRILIEADGE